MYVHEGQGQQTKGDWDFWRAKTGLDKACYRGCAVAAGCSCRNSDANLEQSARSGTGAATRRGYSSLARAIVAPTVSYLSCSEERSIYILHVRHRSMLPL